MFKYAILGFLGPLRSRGYRVPKGRFQSDCTRVRKASMPNFDVSFLGGIAPGSFFYENDLKKVEKVGLSLKKSNMGCFCLLSEQMIGYNIYSN